MIFSSDVSALLFWTKAGLVQIGPQMLLPLRFGSPRLPAAAHLASIHSPDQQRRPHNRHFRPWTRTNTCGGVKDTSAPPLFTDVPSVMTTAAHGPGGKWSVAAFLNFTACFISRQPKVRKEGSLIQNWQRFRLKLYHNSRMFKDLHLKLWESFCLFNPAKGKQESTLTPLSSGLCSLLINEQRAVNMSSVPDVISRYHWWKKKEVLNELNDLLGHKYHVANQLHAH